MSKMLLNNEKHDVKVGLDYSTAIAILQIKCATLVHVSVLNVSCKRSGTDTCTSVAHLICKIAMQYYDQGQLWRHVFHEINVQVWNFNLNWAKFFLRLHLNCQCLKQTRPFYAKINFGPTRLGCSSSVLSVGSWITWLIISCEKINSC